jgi:hypothetical protein
MQKQPARAVAGAKKQSNRKPLVRASIPLQPVSATKVIQKPTPQKAKQLAPTAKTAPKNISVQAVQKIGTTQDISNATSSRHEINIALSPNATVLRSYVLKSPARLVIDVGGQDGTLSLPPPNGFVSNIRTGEHTGYTRIVIDSSLPIKETDIQKTEDGLTVRLNS